MERRALVRHRNLWYDMETPGAMQRPLAWHQDFWYGTETPDTVWRPLVWRGGMAQRPLAQHRAPWHGFRAHSRCTPPAPHEQDVLKTPGTQ